MHVSGLVLGVLLLVASCLANEGARAKAPQTRALQPWLVGLTAVVVFLGIVFILLIANRLLRKDRGEEDDNEEGGIHNVVEVKDEDDDEKQTSF